MITPYNLYILGLFTIPIVCVFFGCIYIVYDKFTRTLVGRNQALRKEIKKLKKGKN